MTSPNAALRGERTERGFIAPEGLVEELGHREDRFFIVRMTRHEYRQTQIDRSGVGIRLLPREDGTFDAIPHPPLEDDCG